eukprot:4704935-Prymnesium_polylepis.1
MSKRATTTEQSTACATRRRSCCPCSRASRRRRRSSASICRPSLRCARAACARSRPWARSLPHVWPARAARRQPRNVAAGRHHRTCRAIRRAGTGRQPVWHHGDHALHRLVDGQLPALPDRGEDLPGARRRVRHRLQDADGRLGVDRVDGLLRGRRQGGGHD